MIRVTRWNPPNIPRPGDLTIDPQSIVSIVEFEDNQTKIARIRFDTIGFYDICDFDRNEAERIATAKRCGTSDMERHEP